MVQHDGEGTSLAAVVKSGEGGDEEGEEDAPETPQAANKPAATGIRTML